MPALPVPRFDQFYRHTELTRLLQDYAAAAPQIVGLSSIGQSFEGRDIWLLTLGNRRSGEDIDRPALWVDGDGRMLSMRIPDPHGPYKKQPADPRPLAPGRPHAR